MIKHIEFLNSRNEKIVGVLKEKNTSGPLLIICHGYKVSKKHPANQSVTNKLYKMGHSAFSFDFSQSAQEFNLAEQVSDIIEVADFFKDYKKKIVVAGSLSAMTGVIAATKSPKIKGLITVNGFFGTGQLKGKALRLYFLFRVMKFLKIKYRNILSYLQANYKPEKITIPILVIHAKKDEQISISQSKDFFKKVSGNKDFYVLETADHHLTKESYRQEVAEIIDKWIRKNKF